MKDRAGRDRGLLRACGAHPHPLAGAPAASAAACRAAEPVRPPQALKVFAAGGVVGEPGPELLVGAGVVDPADGARRRWHGPQSTALKQICRTHVRRIPARATSGTPNPQVRRLSTDLARSLRDDR